MVKITGKVWRFPLVIVLLVTVLACQIGGEDAPAPTSTPTEAPEPEQEIIEPTATPTPTPEPVIEAPPTSTPIPSPCEGVNGSIEVQVLMGPAEVVGLTPHGVGSVPFSVTASEAPWLVEGGGAITYHETYVEDEINYDVMFNADLMLTGVCEEGGDAPQLVLDIQMDWDQMVEVKARDFHGEYPVAGSQTVPVTLSLVDGATASPMEGAELVLHLSQ